MRFEDQARKLAAGMIIPWNAKYMFWLLRYGRKNDGGWDDEIREDQEKPVDGDEELFCWIADRERVLALADIVEEVRLLQDVLPQSRIAELIARLDGIKDVEK
jgi:hypothetical protein